MLPIKMVSIAACRPVLFSLVDVISIAAKVRINIFYQTSFAIDILGEIFNC
jgi:hypothetical protein